MLDVSKIVVADRALDVFVDNIVGWAPTKVMAFDDAGAALTRTGMVILAKTEKKTFSLFAFGQFKCRSIYVAQRTVRPVQSTEARTS